MFGAANFTDKKHPKNPVPKPEHYPRPHEAFKRFNALQYEECPCPDDEVCACEEDEKQGD